MSQKNSRPRSRAIPERASATRSAAEQAIYARPSIRRFPTPLICICVPFLEDPPEKHPR